MSLRSNVLTNIHKSDINPAMKKHYAGFHNQKDHGLWSNGEFPIDADLMALAKKFDSRGYKIYAVGGAVRDFASGKTPHDIDLTTDATPTQMAELFGSAVRDWDDRGQEHGMIRIKSGKSIYEVATHRLDVATDGRHATVSFTTSITEDLKRRDLTINAMAYDLISNRLYGTGKDGDPTPNLKDLKDKIIRFVGNGFERINEDRLRALRAIRFAIRMNGTLAIETVSAIRDAVTQGLIPAPNLSWERISSEMIKTLGHANGGKALRMYKDTGLLFALFPELKPAENQSQNKHHGDVMVLEHIFRTVESTRIPKGDHSSFTGLAKVLGKKSNTDTISAEELSEAGLGVLRLTMMLHDIAKPQTAVEKPNAAGEYSFIGHDDQGADIAHRIATRLKLPSEIIDMISTGVREHMKVPEPDATDSTIRRWARTLYERNVRLRDVGVDLVDWMLSIREADWGALGREHETADIGETKIRSVLSAQPKQNTKPPISGDDVMRITGLKPSRTVGQIISGIGSFLDSNPDASQDQIEMEVRSLYNRLNKSLRDRVFDTFNEPT
jgi:tRNA nucleotidyltransferase (CCA-adding enzyme)